MNLFTAVLYLHIATVAVSVGLFVLRYWWMYHQSPLLNQRWVRIAPHCSDTLLFLSGAGLMAITHYLPFTEDGAWLTEKLFGVIIYIKTQEWEHALRLCPPALCELPAGFAFCPSSCV